jgi:hypothetical protein
MRTLALVALLTSIAHADPEHVKPSATDPTITAPDDDHLVYLPTKAANGKLLVFLPGTKGKPANATRFLGEAASVGYHVIGLDYSDDVAAAQACKDDLACYGTFRQGIIETGPNSIEHRLVAVLGYLAKAHPKDGWAAFLDHGKLAYASIAFAGHSQGGGHAAWIAKHHAVARVLMFSSVVDASAAAVPATWVTEKGATPPERYIGFDHVDDVFAARIAADWKALGLDAFGKRTSIDGANRPFKSHQLTTAVPEPTGMRAHNAVIGDRATPLANDTPVFRDVWDAMLVDP